MPHSSPQCQYSAVCFQASSSITYYCYLPLFLAASLHKSSSINPHINDTSFEGSTSVGKKGGCYIRHWHFESHECSGAAKTDTCSNDWLFYSPRQSPVFPERVSSVLNGVAWYVGGSDTMLTGIFPSTILRRTE